jgi:hypothetical protein
LNNLKKIDDGFELNLQWNRPRPQIIDGPIILNLDIVKTFCERELIIDTTSEIILEKCEILNNYLLDLSQYHEDWMLKRNKVE